MIYKQNHLACDIIFTGRQKRRLEFHGDAIMSVCYSKSYPITSYTRIVTERGQSICIRGKKSVTNIVKSQYSTEQTTRASWRGLCFNAKNRQAFELLRDLEANQ